MASKKKLPADEFEFDFDPKVTREEQDAWVRKYAMDNNKSIRGYVIDRDANVVKLFLQT